MKTLWLTDVHVERLGLDEYKALLQRIISTDAEAIVLTGDIGEPPNNWRFLEDLLCGFSGMVYFVLGNHDYYRNPIDASRAKAKSISQAYPNAYYLTTEPGFYYDKHFILGMGGWGNTGQESIIESTWDGDAIDDLRRLDLVKMQVKLNQLAEADAQALIQKCQAGIQSDTQKVSIFTHVPPSVAMLGRYSIKPLQQQRTIFYSEALSKAFETLLLDFPNTTFYVYSGHIHQAQEYSLNERLLGYVAEAYASKQLFNWIEL